MGVSVEEKSRGRTEEACECGEEKTREKESGCAGSNTEARSGRANRKSPGENKEMKREVSMVERKRTEVDGQGRRDLIGASQ